MTELASPSPSPPGADEQRESRSQGRFVVGSGDSDIRETQPYGSLYSLNVRGNLRELDRDIVICNGPCWSPDDKTFYFSDSLPHQIYAYDYDIETGDTASKRIFAYTRELGGTPDGTTVDTDGLMWMAICEGANVVAFCPDSGIEHIVEMSVNCST